MNGVTAGVQDQPDIAMLEDGSTLVAWHGGGDVLFQRFDAKGQPVPRIKTRRLNTTGTAPSIDQKNPAVTGGSGFFLVAWEVADPSGTADIAARFVGGQSGFGFNSVRGQNDEFVASDAKVLGDRHAPAVALGTFAVVGWEDRSTDHHGVFARRFPAPTAQ